MAVIRSMQRFDLETPALIGVRMLRCQIGSQSVHSSLGLLHGDVRLKPSLGLQVARRGTSLLAQFLGRECKRYEHAHLLVPGKAETCRHYANNGVGSFVEVDRF